tara:strand:+ start:1673 stop:2080 length:408 start_codon:yes stop_codon:yes gene_type:complete
MLRVVQNSHHTGLKEFIPDPPPNTLSRPTRTPCGVSRRVSGTGLGGSMGIDPNTLWNSRGGHHNFFPHTQIFLFGAPKMVYQKKKFTFEVDELTHMKLTSLFGKANYNNNDFIKLNRLMIDSSYSNSKGKKAKGL